MTKIQKVYQGEVVDDDVIIRRPNSQRLDHFGPQPPPKGAGDFKFTPAPEVITRFNDAIPSQIFDKPAPTDWVGEGVSCAIMLLYAIPIILAITGVIIMIGVGGVAGQ